MLSTSWTAAFLEPSDLYAVYTLLLAFPHFPPFSYGQIYPSGGERPLHAQVVDHTQVTAYLPKENHSSHHPWDLLVWGDVQSPDSPQCHGSTSGDTNNTARGSNFSQAQDPTLSIGLFFYRGRIVKIKLVVCLQLGLHLCKPMSTPYSKQQL